MRGRVGRGSVEGQQDTYYSENLTCQVAKEWGQARGLPIIMAGELVGGIGVGGAPGGHLDVACAQAGLESIGAVPKGSAGK